MALDAKILRVFVASPNDVAEERSAVDAVVSEINNTQSQSTGAFLHVIKWETHAYPGLGSDSQQVINEEIGDDYEIFIGILSTRFGTPTKRAESGTAEEFERAYKRYQNDPLLIRVMFYFKDPQIRASELDLDEYGLVKDFQKRLGGEGLYWTFNSAEDFTTYLRMHLTRQIQAWAAGKWGDKSATTKTEFEVTPEPEVLKPESLQAEDDLDIGFLDLIDEGEEYLNSSTASLTRITEALHELTEKLEENTPKLIEASTINDMKRVRHVTNYIAQVMHQFAERTELEMPIFSQSYNAAMNAVSRSATVWLSDFNADDTSGLENLLTNIQGLISSTTTSREQTISMEMAVTGLPRLTGILNKAKKHTKEALSRLSGELTTAQNLTVETEKELRTLLEAS